MRRRAQTDDAAQRQATLKRGAAERPGARPLKRAAGAIIRLTPALLLVLAGCEAIVAFDPAPERGAQCADRIDNDGDGAIDCADSDCAGSAACAEKPRCGNGVVDPALARWKTQAIAVAEPVAAAVGLIDDDAQPDVVVASRGGEVRELRNAAGTLAARPPLTVPGARLTAVGAGVLDGKTVDLLLLDDLEPGVWRVLNSGGGAFGAPLRVASLPAGPSALVLGDFDGNQSLDAVAGGTGGATFLVNDGRGGLRAVAVQAPTPPVAMAAADVDGDQHLDVVCLARDRSALYVLYGGTAGTAAPFTAGPLVAVDKAPLALAVADLDGALGLDLVAASDGANDLTVLLERGDRVYSAATRVPLPAAPTALAAADLDGDGATDLAVALAGGTVAAYFGDGKGGFVAGGDVSIGQAGSGDARALLAVDLDADGRPDLVAVSTAGNQVTVLLNDVLPREDCDDGNTTGGDACPADCRLPR